VERHQAPTLEVRDLGKVFTPDGDPRRRVEALQGITFSVTCGEFVAIVGPSGCGKSTLCEIVGGLIPPSSGQILIKGAPVMGPHPAVGLVFQEDSAFPWLTTLNNVAFGLRMEGVGREERERCARAMIGLVGLSGFEGHHPRELSGGMRQRVAIARTLVMNPELLIMDEPFGALDAQTRLLLGEELLRIWREVRATILFITHDIAEAVRLADRVLIMTARPGRLRRVVSVDLPRPRDKTPDLLAAADRLVAEIWEELREEVLKMHVARDSR
jgi:NitT/TauT family transport system ATP-binding protein